tara:strand:- start:298 stop:981 length:684 start_codon:yes stop_codon:yes gene_type:complete
MVEYVKLINLIKKPELNGTLAELIDYDKEKDRFLVKLCNGSQGMVKIKNVSEVNENISNNSLISPRVFNIGVAPPKCKTNKKKKIRINRKTSNEECSICMDEMKGEVILKCGHKLCPECFAQHSRKNNTCPFCRDEFSPKIQEKSRLSEQVANIMVKEVVEEYFDDEEESEFDEKLDELMKLYKEYPDQKIRINMAKIDIKATLYAHMTETARIMYEDIEEWYDENE